MRSLLWVSVFVHIKIRINYHNKNFAFRHALKERLRGTRKWSILVNRWELVSPSWRVRRDGTKEHVGLKIIKKREDYDEWRRDKAVSPLPQSSLDFFSRPQQFGWSRQTESLEQAMLRRSLNATTLPEKKKYSPRHVSPIWHSELEVTTSLFGGRSVCLNFVLNCLTVALITRKTRCWQRERVKGYLSPLHPCQPVLLQNWQNYQC